MAYSRHILRQGGGLKTMGAVALGALFKNAKEPDHSSHPGHPPGAPGPERTLTLPKRPPDLIRDYAKHVGAPPGAYKHHLPPHMFPQWGFEVLSGVLKGLPYPMTKIVNGGCKLICRTALPSDEPLKVRAWLNSVDDNGYRAVLEQRIITGTERAPDAVEAHLYAIVPLKKREGKKKERPRVPMTAKEVDYFRLPANAGLDFAKLTGDFNPIHWVPVYARAAGFKSTILHGFATMARAMEGLGKVAVGAGEKITCFNVRFVSPLVLPARVGLYLLREERKLYVGDAPGGPAYLTAEYEIGAVQ